MPKNANTIILYETKMPRGEYDFSNVNKLDIQESDLSLATKLILPKNANIIGTKLPAHVEWKSNNKTILQRIKEKFNINSR